MNKGFKNMFRKAAVTGAAAAMAIACAGAAACEGGDDGGKIQINFWGWGSPAEVRVYEQLIAQYMEENEDVTVLYTHYESNNYMNKFQNEKVKPEVFFMPDTDFLSWADAGVMLNLNDYCTQEELGKVHDAAINEYYYNPSTKTLGYSQGAELYGFPKDLGPVSLVYNKTLLDQQITKNNLNRDEVYALLSPTKPMTWEQFRKLLIDLTKDQNKSSTDQIYGIPYYELEAAVYSNNASFFKDNAATQNINQDLIDAIAFNIQLATVDKVMPSSAFSGSTDAYTRFFNGKTLFTWMGPWDNADFWGYPNLDYEIVPVPYNGANPEAKSVSMCGSMCYGISAKTSKKKRQAAVDFAKWLSMGESCQSKAMELGQQVPNLKSMVSDYISTEWNVRPGNRSLFIDMIDGYTNSLGLYEDAEQDIISSKTRVLYYTYDSTWKDNFLSYIDEKKLWDETSAENIKNKLEAYREDLQKDLNAMNKRWKG